MRIEDKIKNIKEELRKTKYNKATESHIARLKAKLAILESIEENKKKRGIKHVQIFKKSGDATIAITGFPNVGKSMLFTTLTGVESKIANYNFTTVSFIQGIMFYRGARIQFVDTPGIVEDAHKGVGMGKYVLSVLRVADLLLIVSDNPYKFDKVEKELFRAGFRFNRNIPDIRIIKKHYGGIDIHLIKGCSLSKHDIADIVKECGIINAEIIVNTKNITYQDIIDEIFGNRVYLKAVRVLTKYDLQKNKIDKVSKKYKCIVVSAKTGYGIENLKKTIYENLDIKRIYLKEPSKNVNKDPIVFRERVRIQDILEKLGKKFNKNFLYAKVWGESVKFQGKICGRMHELKDCDIVEIHIKK